MAVALSERDTVDANSNHGCREYDPSHGCRASKIKIAIAAGVIEIAVAKSSKQQEKVKLD